jgi:hypothetical protein
LAASIGGLVFFRFCRAPLLSLGLHFVLRQIQRQLDGLFAGGLGTGLFRPLVAGFEKAVAGFD